MSNRTPEENARVKELGRESRLSFRNLAEHQLRRELKEEAMEICKPQIKDFAECSQENGLMVVWSCRKHYNAIRECLSVHNGEEAWQKYKEAHKDELEIRAQGNKVLK